MTNLYAYLATIPIIVLAMFPPIEVHVPLSDNVAWVWLISVSVCLGIYTLFTKISIPAKIISAYLLISCFFSKAPAISFSLYPSIVALIYFFILCTKIKDWTPVIRALGAILIINILLMLLQDAKHDTLLNFGLPIATCHGSVGNFMQLKSLLIIASGVFLAMRRPRCWPIFIGIMGVFYLLSYGAKTDIIKDFLYARGPVWRDTIKLWTEHPIVGWGPGTFKIAFPTIAKGSYTLEGVWYTTHNCWLQMLAEIGAIGFSAVLGYFVYLGVRLWKIDLYLVGGLAVIALDMIPHFPTRQIQCTPIMIMFLAYCEQRLVKERGET